MSPSLMGSLPTVSETGVLATRPPLSSAPTTLPWSVLLRSLLPSTVRVLFWYVLQRSAGDKVGGGDDDQVGLCGVATGQQVGKGIEATGNGGRRGDELVCARCIDAVAVGVAVELDVDAWDTYLTRVQRTAVVHVEPDLVAQREFLDEAKVDGWVVRAAGCGDDIIVAHRASIASGEGDGAAADL